MKNIREVSKNASAWFSHHTVKISQGLVGNCARFLRETYLSPLPWPFSLVGVCHLEDGPCIGMRRPASAEGSRPGAHTIISTNYPIRTQDCPIHIHTYTYTVHTHTVHTQYTHTHTHTHTHTYIYSHTHTHTYTQTLQEEGKLVLLKIDIVRCVFPISPVLMWTQIPHLPFGRSLHTEKQLWQSPECLFHA